MSAVTSLDGLGDERVITVNELAAIFQLSRQKITEMLTTGKIEGAFRVGSRLRIRVKDVRAWIESERLPKNQRIHEIRRAARRGAA